jgi:hypothetical protein
MATRAPKRIREGKLDAVIARPRHGLAVVRFDATEWRRAARPKRCPRRAGAGPLPATVAARLGSRFGIPAV